MVGYSVGAIADRGLRMLGSAGWPGLGVAHGTPRRIVGLTAGQHRVGDAGELVGQRHHGDIGMTPRPQGRGPTAEGIRFALDPAHDGARAMNQQLAQVGVAALADAEQPVAAAGGMLAGYQAEEGRQAPAITEQARVAADGGDQGGGDQGTDAGDGHQALGRLALAGEGGNLGVIRGDPRVEVTPLVGQALEAGAEQGAQAILGVLQDLRQAGPDVGASLGDDDAVFREQTTDLVDLGGALRDGLTAQAMDGLEILLLDALDGDETHGGPLRRLGDRFGIGGVVLVGLDEGFDELGGDQLHFVAIRLEAAGPVVGTATGLHGDPARGPIGQLLRQLGPTDLLAEDASPLGVHPAEVKTPLGQVDADHRDALLFGMLSHWSAPLPRLTMVFDIAHCARSGLEGGAGRTIPLPQNFLGRVQTWLEKAARDELHAADQPAEQLFFVTSSELVLPWNFDHLRQRAEVTFQVLEGPERPGPGRTYFLHPTSMGVQPKRTFAPILLRLQPIVHGSVDIDPHDLGGLADLLAARGLDLRLSIVQALQEQVGSEGVPATTDSSFSVLLLEIPVSRAEGAEVERVFWRAYLLLHGPLKLGASCGALMLQNGHYYKEQLTGPFAALPGEGWRTFETLALEVQQGLDRASARRQSGIVDEGPTGTLVGAGALGSAVLDLWTRCGWGQWTVIDNDHVKPHNMVRHIIRSDHIGASKAHAMAALHDAVMRGAGTMTAIHADAFDMDNADVLAALTKATLVVDASTTIDYPRLTSTRDDVARHASIFVTPDANGAVLLMEDAERTMRLRTLEAQYYRALITDEWGREHLSHHLGKYYSGASCRDISFVMPYSRMQAHAALLAEQLQEAVSDPEAAIRIWARDPKTGAVVARQVTVSSERTIKLDNLTLFIDRGLEDKLRTLRAGKLPFETGGILLGYYDFNVDAVVVVDALAAPTDSQASAVFFERGIAGVMDSVAEVSSRTANIVKYIGEWHSHPPRHNTKPSRDDFFQLVYLATGMAHEGLPALQLIVGDNELSVMSMQAL